MFKDLKGIIALVGVVTAIFVVAWVSSLIIPEKVEENSILSIPLDLSVEPLTDDEFKRFLELNELNTEIELDNTETGGILKVGDGADLRKSLSPLQRIP